MASSTSTESSERSPLLPTQPTSDESFLSPPQAPRPSLATPASPSAMAKPSSEGRSKPSRSVSFNPNPVSRTIDASPPSSLPPTPPPAVPLFRNRGGLSTSPMSSAAFSASGRASYGATMTVGGGGGGGAGASEGGGPPVLKALNSRLRRRNSYGSGPPMQFYPQPVPPKIGPQRSTKNAQKLKLLPNPEFGDDGPDEESGRDVYSQYTRIKDPTARRDAAILGKADRNRLPRVTAYCTANRYQMDGLMRFFKGRGRARGSNAKLIDECIYTPYSYHFGKTSQDSGGEDGGGSSYENAAYAAGNDQSSPEAAGHRDELPADNMQETSPAFFQERRHSADEVDADSFQRRRDDLIDLESGEGGDVGGNGHRGHHQRDEEAVADDEEDGRRHNDWDGVHRQGDDLEGFYDAEHREEQQQRQQESSHPRFSHQRQDAVSDVFEDMERGGSGNGGVHEHDGERQDRQQQLQQQEQQQQHQQQQEEQQKQQQQEQQQQQQQDEQQLQRLGEQPVDLDIHVHTPELFLFDYGVVVIWGMSEAQEQRFLKELAKFETEKLAPDDVEAEFFNFYYTREYQARIYNDFIALRDKNNYMTKLAISHALAQSVKTSLFEELIASTIDTCKDIPTQIALTGTIALSRSQINMQIGELFILRINIHLNGSVLDTPELFWVEPQLEPVYRAVRSYLEMDQRVGLLTQRLDVIADLLAVLKEQLSHGHGEMLEWIVIVLIAAEILVAAINIVVDLYAGGE